MAMDSLARQLYVADTDNHVIRRVDMNAGTISIIAGVFLKSGHMGDGASATSAQLRSPYGIDLDATAHLLYVTDTGNHAVRLLDLTSGMLSTVAGVLGSAGRMGDQGPATSAQLQSPYDLAVDPAAQKVYVADTSNHAIRLLDLATGILSTIAGILGSGGRSGDGDPATSAQLYFPYGVTLARAAQQLFVADNWNHAVRRVDLVTGLMTTIAGVLGFYGLAGDGGRADWAQLHSPMGVAVDSNGRMLYVADASNHVVRLVALYNDVRIVPMLNISL